MPIPASNVTVLLPDHSGPGRKREFELVDAVQDAVEVFRANGYHGTSVGDLEVGTGLARGSLYKAFGDKRALFMAALEHYADATVRDIAETLARYDSPREALRAAMLRSADRAAEDRSKGCLLAIASVELVPAEAEVRAVIERKVRRIEDLLTATIIRGQAAGEFPTTLDERAAARMLHCLMPGMRVMAKTASSQAGVTEMIDCALSALR